MARFEINRKFIVENYCVNRNSVNNICNGQCYLNKQLEKGQDQNQELPDILKEKYEMILSDLADLLFLKVFRYYKNYDYSYFNNYFIFLIGKFFHPPQINS